MATRKVNFNRIQWTAWFILYLLLLMYFVREKDTMLRGFVAASANFGFSLLAIYGQSHFLMPRFLRFKWKYVLASLLTLVVLAVLKTLGDYYIFNQIFDHRPFQFNLHHIAVTVLTIFLCFIIGFLMRISLDHVKLLQHQEKLRQQQLLSEINLLKAQVQPHFIFNTLNNIYSLAYRGSEKTAEIVAKLSDIMRYFVHDAPLEKVPILTEVSFITNYIELERIRMAKPLIVDFKVNHLVRKDIYIPPMLFIPFIENYFKHGIDKSKENQLNIELKEAEGFIRFAMSNEIQNSKRRIDKGIGLDNIQRRLELLFDKRFTLDVKIENDKFNVLLTFPILYEYSMPDRG